MVHKHDKAWVMEQIKRIPPEHKAFAWGRYQLVYKEAYNKEPIEHKKSNAARRAANTRLRHFVDKVCNDCE